jgi:hypothetical protein
MNLTVVSLPKAFRDIYGVIQTNAIRSWSRLSGGSVILFGDEEGTAEIVHSIPNATHCSTVERNRFGTPLINYLFSQSSVMADTNWMAYANCDIILPPDLPALVDRIASQIHGPFVLAGRRWNINMDELIDFEDPKWFEKLDGRFKDDRTLYGTAGMDLFVFPPHFYDDMPPFPIGWPGAKYDNWLVWYACHRQIPIVDITDATTIYHQNHPLVGGAIHDEKWKEHRISLKLLGGYGRSYDIRDTTHIALANGTVIRRAWSVKMIPVKLKRWVQILRDAVILR